MSEPDPESQEEEAELQHEAPPPRQDWFLRLFTQKVQAEEGADNMNLISTFPSTKLLISG